MGSRHNCEINRAGYVFGLYKWLDRSLKPPNQIWTNFERDLQNSTAVMHRKLLLDIIGKLAQSTTSISLFKATIFTIAAQRHWTSRDPNSFHSSHFGPVGRSRFEQLRRVYLPRRHAGLLGFEYHPIGSTCTIGSKKERERLKEWIRPATHALSQWRTHRL